MKVEERREGRKHLVGARKGTTNGVGTDRVPLCGREGWKTHGNGGVRRSEDPSCEPVQGYVCGGRYARLQEPRSKDLLSKSFRPRVGSAPDPEEHGDSPVRGKSRQNDLRAAFPRPTLACGGQRRRLQFPRR